MGLALLGGCAHQSSYDYNVASAAQDCTDTQSVSGEYRCHGWMMLRQADKAEAAQANGLNQAGTARLQVADAIDAGRMRPSEAEAVVRDADIAAGLPVEPLKSDDNDPLEPMNRVIFKADMALDHVLIRPAAKVYRTVLPDPVRGSVRHFYDNLQSPITFGNALLQANWLAARDTAGRFAVNSTLGIGGLFDPATRMGLAQHDEDFGQTLGVWGIGEGPYLVLPVLGPKPPRDAVGMVADHFMDPLTYVLPSGTTWLSLGLRGVDFVDKRSRHIESVDEVERTSLDFYATVRSLYRQRRNAEIHNTVGANNPAAVSPAEFEFEDEAPSNPTPSYPAGAAPKV